MSIFRDMWDRLGTPSSSFTPSLLSDVWSPKQTPVRQDASLSSLYILDYHSRLAELGPSTGPPTLTLGGHRLTFQEGQWVLEWRPGPQEWSLRAGGRRSRAEQRLQRRNRALQEENNALKLRVELLMDMLTEAMAQREGLDPGDGEGQDCCPSPQPPSPAPPQHPPQHPARQARRVSYEERLTKRKSQR